MNTKERELYKLAILLWGKEAQTIMAFEELGEEIDILAKVIRGRESKKALASEIADVTIMNEQLQVLFDIEIEVIEQKAIKLKRLRTRTDIHLYGVENCNDL